LLQVVPLCYMTQDGYNSRNGGQKPGDKEAEQTESIMRGNLKEQKSGCEYVRVRLNDSLVVLLIDYLANHGASF